ncbi:MAG: sigma-70 family RNA polymerase sigma factor [Planctomycetes bacterium]|nr:sigma-70 family RNA polymerase sigma factor [Planctomycetota bacterium]
MLEKSAQLVSLLAHSLSGFERLVVELHYIDRMPTSEISDVLEVDEDEVNDALEGIRSRVREVRKAFVNALCMSEAETGELVGAGGAE